MALPKVQGASVNVLGRIQDQYRTEINPALAKLGALETFETARESPHAMRADITICLCLMNASGPCTVTLPLRPVKGKRYTVKDAKGDGATNPITVQALEGKVDGFSSVQVDLDFGSLEFVWNGENWYTV